MELEKLRKGVAANKQDKVAKQTERVLLPDAPERKRTLRKQSPKRKLPRLVPGTPSVPPSPKPQPWQLQQPTTSMTAAVSVRETTPLRSFSPGSIAPELYYVNVSAMTSYDNTSIYGLPAVSTEESANGGLHEDDDACLDSYVLPDEASSDSSDDDELKPSHNLKTDLNSQLASAEENLDPELQLWLSRDDEQTDRHLRTLVPTNHLSFDWNNDPNSFRGQREEFTGPSGPTFTINENDRPLDIFTKFFTDDLLDLIVLETNRYANQTIKCKRDTPSSRLSRWTPTDRGEIAIFLAIIMFQGVAPLPYVNDYFRENGYLTLKYFNQLMTLDRYLLLTRLLHFSNNEDIPKKMRTDEKQLKKIYPILSYLNTKFSTLYLPSQNIAIDESLLKWHGRLGFAQKIASKAAKVGIKSYELCESSTGYLWSFYMYTGKHTDKQTDQQTDELTRQTDELGPPPPTGATSQTVIELARPLFKRGHTLVMDNFYNSPLLARYLKSQGTDCYGTLRVKREFVPQALKRLTKTDFRLGELRQSYCHDLSIVMWRDNNLVSLISTYHSGQVGGKEKNGTYKFKPQVVLDYNKTMGGVDRKDQLLSAYPMERSRGRSWYKKMFRHILNTTVLNSLIIFKTKYPQITQRDFRLQLAESLVEVYRPTQRVVDVEELPRTIAKQHPILRGNHYVGAGPSKFKVCTMCHKSRTKYMCKQCNVALCLLNCFEAYHSA